MDEVNFLMQNGTKKNVRKSYEIRPFWGKDFGQSG